MASASSPPPVDADGNPVDRLSRALDEANAELAAAHAAHEAVRAKLGRRAPPPSTLPRSVPKPDVGSGAYRAKDPRMELERALDDAKTALALLRSETSRLEGECDMAFPDPPLAQRPLGIAALVIGILGAFAGLVWLVEKYGGMTGVKATTGLFVLLLLVLRLLRPRPDAAP